MQCDLGALWQPQSPNPPSSSPSRCLSPFDVDEPDEELPEPPPPAPFAAPEPEPEAPPPPPPPPAPALDELAPMAAPTWRPIREDELPLAVPSMGLLLMLLQLLMLPMWLMLLMLLLLMWLMLLPLPFPLMLMLSALPWNEPNGIGGFLFIMRCLLQLLGNSFSSVLWLLTSLAFAEGFSPSNSFGLCLAARRQLIDWSMDTMKVLSICMYLGRARLTDLALEWFDSQSNQKLWRIMCHVICILRLLLLLLLLVSPSPTSPPCLPRWERLPFCRFTLLCDRHKMLSTAMKMFTSSRCCCCCFYDARKCFGRCGENCHRMLQMQNIFMKKKNSDWRNENENCDAVHGQTTHTHTRTNNRPHTHTLKKTHTHMWCRQIAWQMLRNWVSNKQGKLF